MPTVARRPEEQHAQLQHPQSEIFASEFCIRSLPVSGVSFFAYPPCMATSRPATLSATLLAEVLSQNLSQGIRSREFSASWSLSIWLASGEGTSRL